MMIFAGQIFFSGYTNQLHINLERMYVCMYVCVRVSSLFLLMLYASMNLRRCHRGQSHVDSVISNFFFIFSAFFVTFNVIWCWYVLATVRTWLIFLMLKKKKKTIKKPKRKTVNNKKKTKTKQKKNKTKKPQKTKQPSPHTQQQQQQKLNKMEERFER